MAEMAEMDMGREGAWCGKAAAVRSGVGAARPSICCVTAAGAHVDVASD